MAIRYITDPQVKLDISRVLGFRGGDLTGNNCRVASYSCDPTNGTAYVEAIENGYGVRLTELASGYELVTWGGGSRIVHTIREGQVEPSEQLAISRERILAAPRALAMVRLALG